METETYITLRISSRAVRRQRAMSIDRGLGEKLGFEAKMRGPNHRQDVRGSGAQLTHRHCQTYCRGLG